ncbi:MAG TPA: hypothetical protein VFE28_08310 [Candidatus Krumholzibacteria bacterium]|nr:hypothetical protein [Candidatus Krumholzibacteria bacterium]
MTPWIRAGVTRVDGGTVHVSLEVHAPSWIGAVPVPQGDVVASVSIFAVRGNFGAATNLVPPGHHRVLEIENGDIVWGADWLAPALDTGFDLTAESSALYLDYRCTIDYYVHTESLWDRFELLTTETSSGILQAAMPATLGQTIWLRDGTVPATAQTWGGVKALFR